MKIKTLTTKQKASALITVIVFTSIMSFILAYILTSMSTEHRQTIRSKYWNEDLFMAEAGVDMIWNELNKNITNTSIAFRSSDGWATTTPNPATTNVGSFTFQLKEYSKTVDYAVDNPVGIHTNIVLTLKAKTLYTIDSFDDPITNYVVYANATIPTMNPVMTRALLVYLERLTTGGNYMKGTVDMNGNNIKVDSYKSENGNYSSQATNSANGQTYARSNGHIGTTGTYTNAFKTGGADIFGHIAVGPGGTFDFGSQFYQAPNKKKITDFTAEFPDASIPSDFNSTATYTISNSNLSTSGSLTGEAIGSDGWKDITITSIDISGNSDKKLVLDGKLRIHVTGNVSIGGSASIELTANSQVEVYMAGQKWDAGGNGVVNKTQVPSNFQLYGTPTMTEGKVHGNGGFFGIINAPNADFMNVGNGDIYGAMVVKSLKLTGNSAFHYDESTRKKPPAFNVAGWYELGDY